MSEVTHILEAIQQGDRQAAEQLLPLVYHDLRRLHRVWADTDPRNGSSIRALERLGFRREGFLREHYLVHGEPQHAIVYGLLRSDWQRDGFGPRLAGISASKGILRIGQKSPVEG